MYDRLQVEDVCDAPDILSPLLSSLLSSSLSLPQITEMACASTLGVTLMCFSLLLLQFGVSQSAEFTVGDGDGWNYDVTDWPTGKSFKEGDVLCMFLYIRDSF